MSAADLARARCAMVDQQIARRGVTSPRVLDAMKSVPREAFLPESLRAQAYEDSPLPIDEKQTISQPYIVALMIEALDLRGDEKVLEIGTGSGYAAAVLAHLAREVYTVERIASLADKSKAVLLRLGYDNVHVRHADGTRGLAGEAPFGAIVVTAGGPKVPASLKSQLEIGGRIVIPIGTYRRAQALVRLTRLGEDQYQTDDLAEVRFVPLVGAEGWDADPERAADRTGFDSP